MHTPIQTSFTFLKDVIDLKKVVFIFLLCTGFLSYSQGDTSDHSGIGATIGYKRTNTNNISLGVSKYFYGNGYYASGGTVIEAKYITNFTDNHIAVVGASVVLIAPSVGLNVSTEYVEPNIGIDLKFVKLNVGYAVNYTGSSFFTFGLQATFPVIELQ